MKKRPSDPIQLANLIGKIATGQVDDIPSKKPSKKKKAISEQTKQK